MVGEGEGFENAEPVLPRLCFQILPGGEERQQGVSTQVYHGEITHHAFTYGLTRVDNNPSRRLRPSIPERRRTIEY